MAAPPRPGTPSLFKSTLNGSDAFEMPVPGAIMCISFLKQVRTTSKPSLEHNYLSDFLVVLFDCNGANEEGV